MSHTIIISLPNRALNPNARVHWAKAAKAKAAARHEAKIIGLASPLRYKLYKLASTHVVYYHPTNRRRDADNHLAMLKATFDGLADAGVVANDSGFVHYPLVFEVDLIKPRVEITIKEL